MANGSGQVEDLKRLISAFVVELDTPTMPYVNEGLLGTVELTQMSEADRAAGRPGFAVGYPGGGEPLKVFNAGRSSELRLEATSFKRNGQYLAAAERVIESFRLDGHYDLVNLRNLWKTALCGGDARGAVALILKAVATYERYEIARRHERLPYPPQEDLDDVLEALGNEQSCKDRLQAFSGNPAYVLPRPYSAMLADLREQGSLPSATAPQPTAQTSSGGCYVATAVYGGYDAPEVVVLRRFRDERLKHSVLGRTFISIYYALSPSLARRLPRHQRLSVWTRRLLDSIVGHLQARP